jgi:hypothetical protein
MESKSKIVEPRTDISFGDVVIASNVEVTAKDHGTYYSLENSRILVNISKNGTADSMVSLSTSDLIRSFKLKDPVTVLTGAFTFTVGPTTCGTTGFGFTELVPSGNHSDLGDAKVILHMNPNATSCSYDLELSLESEADFLKVDVKNFMP